MNRLLIYLALLGSPCLAQYQYFYPGNGSLGPISGPGWTQNGTITGGYNLPVSLTSGSLIAKQVTSAAGNPVEVSFTIPHPNAGSGVVAYLRASQDAHHSMNNAFAISGSYLAVTLSSIVYDASGGCTADINVFKREGGILSWLSGKRWVCRDNMTIRVFDRHDLLTMYVDGVWENWVLTSDLPSARQGLGWPITLL